jgi:soluble lytic murein transglycosylase
MSHSHDKTSLAKIALITSWTLVFLPQPSVAQASLKKPTPLLLSQVISKDLGGLRLESQDKQNALLRDAKLYAKFQRGTQNSDLKKLQERCKQNLNLSPFCPLMKESETKERESKTSHSKESSSRSPRSRILSIQTWIQDGDVDRLSQCRETEIREAFKGMPFDSFQKVSGKVLDAPACKHTFVAMLLGAKAEENLPDSDTRTRAVQLYQKAAPCGDNEVSARSKFRSSLLSIWNGECKTALPQLRALAAQVNYNDYRSRALYWQFYCGNQIKDTAAVSEAKQNLVEKYPFSLQTVLVQREGNSSDLPIPFLADSELAFRSQRKPTLNSKVTAIEALLAIQETALAKEILDGVSGELETTEPEFRIYTAVLYDRMNQYLKKFKVLNALFREHPQFVSKPSLELYYSQKTLQAHDLSRLDVDRTLILSLIRQESAFNSQARSPAGALGLMQIMPMTARRIAQIRRPSELLKPTVNLRVGSKYFSHLLRNYGGDSELALAAYNAGPHRVDAWLKRYPVKDRILFLDLIPFKETREYVASIARNYFWYITLFPNSATKALNSKLEVPRQPQRNLAEVFSLFGT